MDLPADVSKRSKDRRATVLVSINSILLGRFKHVYQIDHLRPTKKLSHPQMESDKVYCVHNRESERDASARTDARTKMIAPVHRDRHLGPIIS